MIELILNFHNFLSSQLFDKTYFYQNVIISISESPFHDSIFLFSQTNIPIFYFDTASSHFIEYQYSHSRYQQHASQQIRKMLEYPEQIFYHFWWLEFIPTFWTSKTVQFAISGDNSTQFQRLQFQILLNLQAPHPWNEHLCMVMPPMVSIQTHHNSSPVLPHCGFEGTDSFFMIKFWSSLNTLAS